MDSVGEGEGGMIWENGIETCIIPYMKWEKKKKVSLIWKKKEKKEKCDMSKKNIDQKIKIIKRK